MQEVRTNGFRPEAFVGAEYYFVIAYLTFLWNGLVLELLIV